MIYFEADQEDFEDAPQEAKDHLWQAFIHKARLGPHPGKKAFRLGETLPPSHRRFRKRRRTSSATAHP
jgi:hypothetical protein